MARDTIDVVTDNNATVITIRIENDTLNSRAYRAAQFILAADDEFTVYSDATGVGGATTDIISSMNTGREVFEYYPTRTGFNKADMLAGHDADL